MKIKKQYEMNETAWIHIGDGKLHKGKVIDIFDLEHAGYSKDIEFYIVELPSSIEPLLEVRTWSNMSQDAMGPIGAYREIKQGFSTKKYLGKMGLELPYDQTAPVLEGQQEDFDVLDPTPEQVNAAIERAEQAKKMMYNSPAVDKPKRYYKKKPSKVKNI